MKNKKSIVAIAGLALIIGIAGTFAYFRFTESFDNIFKLSEQNTKFIEVFDSPENWTPCTETPKELSIENTSTFAIKARVKANEWWDKLDENGRETGERLPITADGETMAVKDINTTDWIYNSTDGYYYYNGTIGVNSSSSKFINKVTFNCNAKNEYSSARYHLKLTVQTLQADGTWN